MTILSYFIYTIIVKIKTNYNERILIFESEPYLRIYQILGLRHENGEMRVSPSPDVVLVPGDTVVALGTREQLDSLGQALGGGG